MPASGVSTPRVARLEWTVTAGGVALEPSQGSVTWEELGIPSLRAECVIPYTASTWAALNPLEDARATVRGVHKFTDDAGRMLDGSTEALPDDVLELDLGVRSRRRIRTAAGEDSITLTLACDEALALDYRPTTNVLVSGTTVRAVVNNVLARLGLGPVVITGGAVGALPAGWQGNWNAGVSAWDFMATAVDGAGMLLRCDNTRTWRLGYGWNLGGVNLNASYVEAARLEHHTTRDEDWYDGVVLEHEWTDGTDTDRHEFDVYAPGTPSRVYHERRTTPRAPGAAQYVYQRTVERGDHYIAEQAYNLRVRPQSRLFVQMAAGEAQADVGISRVQWQMSTATMTVTGRSGL